MGALQLVTPPAAEPVTYQQAKDEVRLDSDFEEALVERKLREARAWAENLTRRAFITQTLRLWLDEFPGGIELPRAPVQSISSIQYIDASGELQTLAASEYQADLVSEPARIIPAYGKHWPTTRAELNAVRVTFVAGYGDAAENIPLGVREIIQEGILARVVDLFEHRGSVIVGTVQARIDSRTAEAILQPIRMLDVP